MNTPVINAANGMTATTPRFACLAKDTLQAHSKLVGETIHCTSGHLWVTLEDDGTDHILTAGKSIAVPNRGKVLMSGPGCYHITPDEEDLKLELAS